MDNVKKASSGALKISEDVIITVAKLAALDVKGVAGLSGEVNKLSKLKQNGPIKVKMYEDVAALDIKIKVKRRQDSSGCTGCSVGCKGKHSDNDRCSCCKSKRTC
jgi:uncharacterized alkaline shock family protein YloU